jgi:ribosomal protein S18 acetylase RimI-like enzyme
VGSGKEPTHYRLTAASPSDDVWLDELRRDVYRDLFEATWGGWDEPRHQRHFAECMKLGGISIIEIDGARVGMVQLCEVSDGVEVREIQVEPRHQNRGVGTAVLRDVMAAARARGRCVRLSVGLENQGALRLYERLGFRRVGRSDTHHDLMYGPA